jgi:hypothetical protein
MRLMRIERLRSVRRVLGMGLPELAGRGRQGACRWLERTGMTRPPSVAAATAFDVDQTTEAWTRRFFGEHDDDNALPVDGRLQETWQELIVRAERICDGKFDLLGYRGLSFGEPIDWHFEPVSGRRSPRVHWSRVNPLDAAVVGDAKIVWELNRHQWLVHLGEAYRLTGDERYAITAETQLRAWLAANPPAVGINWSSSLEVALRLISWCWAIHLFRRSAAMSQAIVAELLRWIAVHAAHVEQYLSFYFSPNTHLTGEALGLFYAGTLLGEHPRGAAWRSLGKRILIEQSERQIHADGVYFEQSTYYQRYTIEIYLHFLILAARNGEEIPQAVAARVCAMVDFLLSVRQPNGSMPLVGDADGGWILPFELRAADDFRGVFSIAAAFFRRADYAWAAGGPSLESFFLLGQDGVTAFDRLAAAPPAQSPSRVFRDGGYAVMRSGWGADDHHLLFDVGPLGCPHSGGHGHADLLSVQCAAFGEPYLVDPGTGSYAQASPAVSADAGSDLHRTIRSESGRAAPAWRDYFRSTAAHSTVVIDGIGQATPAGPFTWTAKPRARLRRWVSNETYDLADADHDAYRMLPDPVVHRRRVLFVKPRYWIVVDDLDGRKEHRVDVNFQCAAVDLTVKNESWVLARRAGNRGVAIGAFSTVPLERAFAAGTLDPIRGWLSPEYGQRVPAPILTYSVSARLPLRVITAIVPFADALTTLPSVPELLSCVALLES